MMPVMRPSAGGTPEAIEIPMHNGSATRKTTTEATISLARCDIGASFLAGKFHGRLCHVGRRVLFNRHEAAQPVVQRVDVTGADVIDPPVQPYAVLP